MPRPAPRLMLRGLAGDVGLPLVGLLRAARPGRRDWVALLAATGVAAARIVWVAVRERELNRSPP